MPEDVRGIVLSRRARALGGLGDTAAVHELTRQAEDRFGSSRQDSATVYQDTAFGGEELASDLGHAHSPSP